MWSGPDRNKFPLIAEVVIALRCLHRRDTFWQRSILAECPITKRWHRSVRRSKSESQGCRILGGSMKQLTCCTTNETVASHVANGVVAILIFRIWWMAGVRFGALHCDALECKFRIEDNDAICEKVIHDSGYVEVCDRVDGHSIDTFNNIDASSSMPGVEFSHLEDFFDPLYLGIWRIPDRFCLVIAFCGT